MGLQIRKNGPAYEILVPEVVSQYLNIHEQLPSPMFGLSLFLLPNFVCASSAGAFTGCQCDMYSKTCVKQPLKFRQKKILMTNGSLMKVESIAECSPWSILQYF